MGGDGGRLAGGIIAGQRQHTAITTDAGQIGVLESIAAAVDAGTLSIPDAEHAVVFGIGQQVGGLAAQDGGGGQLFVDGGDEANVMVVEQRRDLLQDHIERADGRAAVAGDQAAGADAAALVGAMLIHRQARQGLNPAHDDATVFQGVTIFQREVAESVARSFWRRRRLFG